MAGTLLRIVTQIYHRKNVFQGLVLASGLILIYYIFHTTTESKKIEDFIERHRVIIPQDPDLEFIPDSLLQRNKCPACFGETLCDEMKQGMVKMRPQIISSQDFGTGAVYSGKYEEDEVIIKTLVPEADWKRFDAFLCANSTGNENCDVASAIMKSYMSQTAHALAIPHLREAYKIMHKSTDGISVALCLTQAVLDEVKDVHAIGVGDEKEAQKTAEVYTSTVINQEAMLAMYLKVSQADWPLLEMEGSCGRALVYKHPGKPLKTFLEAPWKQRADLGMQVLALIESFVNGDTDLVLAISDLSYENFAVDGEGQVVYTDMSTLLVRSRDEINDADLSEVCNHDCFKVFTQGLLNSARPKEQKAQCAKMSQVAPNIMYALACKFILSDLPEHKKNRSHTLPGLLHDLPPKHEKTLREHLQECVEEKEPSGRFQSVDDMIDILSEYANPEL